MGLGLPLSLTHGLFDLTFKQETTSSQYTMKILIILLSVFFASPTLASWTLIAKDGEGNSHYYFVTRDSFTKIGTDTVRFWALIDVEKNNNERDFKSFKALIELDCSNKKNREIQMILYDKNMGKGKVIVTSNDTSSWSYISPNSIQDIGAEIICRDILPTLK